MSTSPPPHPALSSSDPESLLTARLLIAMPGMADHRFEKSVIYLCAHSDDGAMGLVINRPLPDLPFAKLLKHLDITTDAQTPALPVHFGGPVERGRGFVLHDAGYHAPRGTMEITPQIRLSATLEVITAIARGTGPVQRIFGLGYAGWGPGQLEDEIAQNVWMLADAPPDLVFDPDSAGKWAKAMRQAGVDPRLLSSQHGHA